MSDSNSIAHAVSAKTNRDVQPHTTGTARPAKPYPEFPLTPHRAGYWCKKIRGTLHYFGPRWNPIDPAAAVSSEAALAGYEHQPRGSCRA